MGWVYRIATGNYMFAIGDVKCWTAALTQPQIAAEISYYNNVLVANNYLATPLQSASDLSDVSGNNHPWTANGTLTTEADPPGVSYYIRSQPWFMDLLGVGR